jgi:hypothetical protein
VSVGTPRASVHNHNPGKVAAPLVIPDNEPTAPLISIRFFVDYSYMYVYNYVHLNCIKYSALTEQPGLDGLEPLHITN